MRGVSRGAPGGSVAAARSALNRVVVTCSGESGHKVRAFELATQAVEHARASGDAASLAWALSQYAFCGDVSSSV